MPLNETTVGECRILQPQGRLDAVTAPDLEKRVAAVIDGGARRVVLDLSRLDYLSSAGLRALLSGAKRLQQAGGRLALAAVSAPCKPVLDMAGLAAIVPLYDAVTQAAAALAPAGAPAAAPAAAGPGGRPAPLGIAEEIYLLALDEQAGYLRSLPPYALDYALAGALLTDLALRDRIDTDLAVLRVVSDAPTGDPLLDDALRALKRETAPQPVSEWLKRFAEQTRIPQRVLARLVEKGILKQVDQKVLWVFAVRRYPVADDREVKEVRARLRELVLGGEIPDPRDLVLLSLARASRLLNGLFTQQEIPAVSPRVEALSKLDLIGRDTLEAIREIEKTMALMNAAIL